MDIYTIYADHTPKINAYHFAKKMKLFLDKMVELDTWKATDLHE